MFRSVRNGRLWLVILSCALLPTFGHSTAKAQELAGTEATIMLIMSPEAFETFVLPDSEEAVGILLTGPSDGTADTVTTASGNFVGWGGTYNFFKTVKYISKGGVSPVKLYFKTGTASGNLPPCLKIGGDRGLDVAPYYASFNGNQNLVEEEDPQEAGSVVVFLYGRF